MSSGGLTSSGIRIRIPAKSSQEPSPMQPQSPEPTSARRKSVPSKRRVAIDSDDDDDDVVMREPQRPQLKRARKSYNLDAEHMDVDDDMDDDAPGSSSTRLTKADGKSSAKKAGAVKKKRTAVYSSDEDFVDSNRANSQSPAPHLQLSDGDYEFESAAHSKPVRQKTATWKVRAAGGVAAGTSKGSKAVGPKGTAAISRGKATKKDQTKEILMKDERKRAITPPMCQTSVLQAQLQSQSLHDEDITLDVVNDHISTLGPESSLPASASQPKEPSPPPLPKKKKLPTIRKNKPAVFITAAGNAMPVNLFTALPPKPPTVINAEKEKEKEKSGTSTSTLAAAARKPVVTSDFDLRDKSAWASIFKQTGGSTPRSGLSRREKEEERRKELYKMRDEARAKRNEILKTTFDLQASWDKISRFEERLRADRCSALYPNLFAAKFKDEYERERKRKEKEARGETRVHDGEINQRGERRYA